MSQLSALLDSLGITLAELDMQKANKQGNFVKYLASLAKNRQKSLQAGDENISSRGLLQSGIALKQQVDTNTSFDNTQAEATNTQTEQLAAIARQRLQAEATFQLRKAELEAAAAAAAQPSTIAAATPVPVVEPAATSTPASITPSPYKAKTTGSTIVKKAAATKTNPSPAKPSKPRPITSNPLKVGVM